MDIRKPVPSNYGYWIVKFGESWKSQVSQLKSRFGDKIEETRMPGEHAVDVPVVYIKKEAIVEVLRFVKNEPGFEYNFLADLTAGDEMLEPRFEVIYNLFSTTKLNRIRFKVRLRDGESVSTLTSLWPAANWLEREVFDMFGIRFAGHPDLRRILMDERYVGHPLRKDFPLKGNLQTFSTAELANPKLLDGAGAQKSREYDSDDIWDDARTVVNIGPTHPATHGAFRVVASLNGETVENSYCEFGFTHRAKEKMGENRTYHQWIVYTDRMNYCSSALNNVAYAMSVERLLGIEITERNTLIRMIVAEMSRAIDHLVCFGINAVDLGAFSFFLYGFHQREEAYSLLEKLCGARLTTSFVRIGGLMYDAPDGWEKEVKAWVKKTRGVLKEMDKLLTDNKIWRLRTEGVAVFTKEDCLKYSCSGPIARAAGVDIDLRRDQPCMFYKDVEFDVPIGKNGDIFDRYLVRFEEVKQSLNIIEQCAERMRPGAIWVEDKRVRIPEKDQVYNTMEGLIYHFKFYMHGIQVPSGEAYTPFEAANGEFGFHIVSKGGARAHRMRVRGPSVLHYQALSPMVKGEKIADLVGALGSLNIIAGELDR